MADTNPPSVTKRIVVCALGLLFAAWAIATSIQLLASVWLGLVIVVVITLGTFAVVWWKRHRGW